MDLKSKRLHERQKYLTLYSDESRPAYGVENHGSDAIDLLEQLKVTDLVDIGCGHNLFAPECLKKNIPAIGVDFANKNADFVCPAHELPFQDNSFSWLTAFDMLEHLLPEEVDDVLAEFARVTRVGWIFSICYRQSTNKVNGEFLHPMVQPEVWWIGKLTRFITVEKYHEYLFGELIYGMIYLTNPLDTGKMTVETKGNPSCPASTSQKTATIEINPIAVRRSNQPGPTPI